MTHDFSISYILSKKKTPSKASALSERFETK